MRLCWDRRELHFQSKKTSLEFDGQFRFKHIVFNLVTPYVVLGVIKRFIHRFIHTWLCVAVWWGVVLRIDSFSQCENIVVASHGGEINFQNYARWLTGTRHVRLALRCTRKGRLRTQYASVTSVVGPSTSNKRFAWVRE